MTPLSVRLLTHFVVVNLRRHLDEVVDADLPTMRGGFSQVFTVCVHVTQIHTIPLHPQRAKNKIAASGCASVTWECALCSDMMLASMLCFLYEYFQWHECSKIDQREYGWADWTVNGEQQTIVGYCGKMVELHMHIAHVPDPVNRSAYSAIQGLRFRIVFWLFAHRSLCIIRADTLIRRDDMVNWKLDLILLWSENPKCLSLRWPL